MQKPERDKKPKVKRLVKLLLDSGAFSAWNRGETLDLQEYIDYLHKHKHLLESYVNMDVIPAGLGKERTKKSLELSAAKSYENLQTMKAAGLSPIPVFHQGEDMSWLYKMLDDGERYIGFSSEKDFQHDVKRQWLDRIFSIITDAKGRPLIKSHGFGITRMPLLIRYPWTTVDSATWSLSPGFGTILVPSHKNGKPDFSARPVNITMSGIMSNPLFSWKKIQYEAMGEHHQAVIERWLREEVGVTITEARYLSTARRRASLIYFMRLAEHQKDVRFKEGRHVEDVPESLKHAKHIPPQNLTIMYATNLNREWEVMMTEVGCVTRLISYYELKGRPTSLLEEIVTKGMHGGEYKRTIPKKANWKSEHYRTYRRMKLLERFPHDDTNKP